MSFDVNWDIDKHKEEHESDDHWQLRRNFMECWKQNYPEERLVCLGRVFANIEFMGCRYPQEVMQEVARMSKEVKQHITYNNEYVANLPDSSANVQSLAHDYTSAEYVMPKETTQDSVSFTTSVYPNSYDGGPTNQGYGEMLSPYSKEAMQALVRIPEGLRPPHCNSFINENIPSQHANNNSTGITKPSDIQIIDSVNKNCYQNKNSANHLLSWQNRDPRIQAAASIQMEMDNSQLDGIQSTNLQANRGLHTDGTHNEYEPISHSVNARISTNDMTAGLQVLPAEDQRVRINCNNITDKPKQPGDSLGLSNVAIASCSQQFTTLPHQIAHGNQIPPPQGHNLPFGNNYNAIHITYPKASKEFQRKKRKTKLNIVIGDKRIKGSMARRYAYWLNAGKTEAEAEYLCQIPVNDIPEYHEIKEKIGSICQMKKLNGSTIPTMKKKPKTKTNLPVKSNDSKAATKTIKESCVKEPENCGTTDDFPAALRFSGKKVRKRYKFWKKLGKTDKEAVILCKQSYVKIKQAQELMAEANRLSINWQRLALNKHSQLDAKKPLEAKSVNPTQPEEKAKIKTNEEPDIIEITAKDPEAIVISDDDENYVAAKFATDIHKYSANLNIEKEAERKRFNWWKDQGKSEEEATVLSKKPMAISDAINQISNDKTTVDTDKKQDKYRVLNVKENESRKDDSQIRDQITQSEKLNSNPLKEKWLAFKEKEEQRISTQRNQRLKIAKSRKIATDDGNQLKIYITEVHGKIGFKESLRIRDAIAQCISDYDGMSMPGFGICQGVFVVICTDETSRDLLDKQIPTLEPWKGARLNIVTEIEDKVFAQFSIRTLSEGGLHKLSKNIDILEKLHEQNPELGCNNWLVFNSKSVKDGLLLMVRFDNKSNDALKSVGYKLRWYLRNINVMVMNKSQNNRKEENKLFMLNPPNIKESAPFITKEVSTIMPQSEVDESTSNMKEKTTVSMAPGSIICNEGTIIKISNVMTPNLVAPQHAGPSSSLPIKQKNEQAASNNKNFTIPHLKNLAQPTSAEQASKFSTMANISKQRKVGNSADSWRIDTPRLLSGHKNAITLKTDPQGCSDGTDSDDGGLKVKYCREVRPFSGQDEEISLEERFATRTLIGGQEQGQEYSREERSFDEQEKELGEEYRAIQDFRHNEQVLAEQYQEYSVENRFSDRQSPKNYDEGRLEERDAKYSRHDRGFGRRLQDCSREVFDEHLGTTSLNYKVQDTPQVERVLAGQRKEYSEDFREERVLDKQDKVVPSEDMIDSHDYSHDERVLATQSHEYLGVNRFSDRQSQENSVKRRFDERDAEYSRNYEVLVERHHESPREVFYEHEVRTSLKIRVFPDEERVLDGQSQKYFTENREYDRLSRQCSEDRCFDQRNPENSGDNRLYEKRSPDHSGDGRLDKRDAEYSRNYRGFDKRDQEYTQERGLAGRFQGYSREDREFDPRTDDNYFSERDLYSGKDSYVEANQMYSRKDAGRDQKYSDESDRPRSSTHEIWPIQASNRPHYLGNHSKRGRSQSRGTLKLQSTYNNDKTSYRPRKKRAKKKN